MGQDEVLALIEQAAAEGWTELDLSGQGLRGIPAAITLIAYRRYRHRKYK